MLALPNDFDIDVFTKLSNTIATSCVELAVNIGMAGDTELLGVQKPDGTWEQKWSHELFIEYAPNLIDELELQRESLKPLDQFLSVNSCFSSVELTSEIWMGDRLRIHSLHAHGLFA